MTSIRLHLLDWLFSRETKPFEFWGALFALMVGWCFVHNDTSILALYQVSEAPTNKIFLWPIPALGLVLFAGAFVQLAGLFVATVTIRLSRALRWLGGMLEGAVWGTCLVFMLMHEQEASGRPAIYALFFVEAVWTIMSIAYRGSRGTGTD